MNFSLDKIAALSALDSDDNSSNMTDPRTGLPIYCSITIRKKYRENYYSKSKADTYRGREMYENIRNSELNKIIAQDFAANHTGALHMFPARTSSISTRKRDWIGIRKIVTSNAPFNFFFAIIRPSYIGIIGASTKWFPVAEDKRTLFLPRT